MPLLGAAVRMTVPNKSMTPVRGLELPLGVARTLCPQLRRDSKLMRYVTLVLPGGAEHDFAAVWRWSAGPYVSLPVWRCVCAALGLAAGDVLELTPEQQDSLRLHVRRVDRTAEPASAQAELASSQQQPPPPPQQQDVEPVQPVEKQQQDEEPAQPAEERVTDTVAEPESPHPCCAVPPTPSDVTTPSPEGSCAQTLVPIRAELRPASTAAPVAGADKHSVQQHASSTAQDLGSPAADKASEQEPAVLSVPTAAAWTNRQTTVKPNSRIPVEPRQRLGWQTMQRFSAVSDGPHPHLPGLLTGPTRPAAAPVLAPTEPLAGPGESPVSLQLVSASAQEQTSAASAVALEQHGLRSEAAAAIPATGAGPTPCCHGLGVISVEPARSQQEVAQQLLTVQADRQAGLAQQHGSAAPAQGPADVMEVDDDELVDIGVGGTFSSLVCAETPAADQTADPLLLRAQQRALDWDALAAGAGCSRAVPYEAIDVMDKMRSSPDSGIAAFGELGSVGSTRSRILTECWQHCLGEDGCSRAVSRADVAGPKLVARAIISALDDECQDTAVTAEVALLCRPSSALPTLLQVQR